MRTFIVSLLFFFFSFIFFSTCVEDKNTIVSTEQSKPSLIFKDKSTSLENIDTGDPGWPSYYDSTYGWIIIDSIPPEPAKPICGVKLFLGGGLIIFSRKTENI